MKGDARRGREGDAKIKTKGRRREIQGRGVEEGGEAPGVYRVGSFY